MRKNKLQTGKIKRVQRDGAIVYLLLTMFFVLLLLYTYFVTTAVMHVAMRVETESAMAKVHSELSELESSLMFAQHRISEEVASLEGYTEVSTRTYVDRRGSSLVLREGF